ncbi:MAG: phosphoribosylformylglycinamidine synthase I [Armatimonadota bacterium]
MSLQSSYPNVAILYAPGINCHEETAFAVEQVGLRAHIVNFHNVITGDESLRNYQAVIIPGGFSWGDHLGAGRIFGVHLVSYAADQLTELVEDGKPILGICNGFQVLVETGLLPDRDVGHRKVALLQNRSAVFESRWVELIVSENQCVWTKGLEGLVLRMPVAHGEGRLYWDVEGPCLAEVDGDKTSPNFADVGIRPVIWYSKDGCSTDEYPANPNGTPGGVAGICDSTGLIFGLMPHPERATVSWHGSTDGLLVFKNLAAYLRG